VWPPRELSKAIEDRASSAHGLRGEKLMKPSCRQAHVRAEGGGGEVGGWRGEDSRPLTVRRTV